MKATQLVPLPLSTSMSPEQSASAVASTVASDILNRDGEGRKDDIPQGKVSVDDLTQEILDGRNNRKVNNIKKRPAASDHKEQPTKKQKDSILARAKSTSHFQEFQRRRVLPWITKISGSTLT